MGKKIDKTKVENIEEELEKDFHVSWFIISYKFLFGLAELLLGLGIVFFGRNAFLLYRNYASQELFEDPHDILARFTENFIPYILAHHTYIVIYLIILGSAKIAGSIGLIYKKNWGVDLLVALTLIMLPFQTINLILHPSLQDFVYIFVGLLISLYLVNFKPKIWAVKMIEKSKTIKIKGGDSNGKI